MLLLTPATFELNDVYYEHQNSKAMTQEEKELLLKDLSARLPYGTLISGYFSAGDGVERHFTMPLNTSMLEELRAQCVRENTSIDNISLPGYYFTQLKPYLRPMSSMTEEEKEEYEMLQVYPGFKTNHTDLTDMHDWLNEHHFDYRGLISMGIAFKAPDGMYN